MTFDVDDVGALACLHALADLGEADILMVSFNEVHPNGPSAIHAINSWYGREHIPIGVAQRDLSNPDGSRYLDHIAKMASSSGEVPVQEAVKLYREVLTQQPDKSVTIVSVGFLNTLAELLEQERDLIERSVAELVLMGGHRNDRFNFVRHNLVESTQQVIENWPTPIVVTDFGVEVETGGPLAHTDPENPVREAYFRWFNRSFGNRASWDQVAVLYGVRATGNLFELQTSGSGSLPNGYSWSFGENRPYLRPIAEADVFEKVINELMIAEPRRTDEQ